MIRRGAALLALAAALSGVPAVFVAAPAAARADEAADPVAEATRLQEEAREFEKVAGDADIDGAERKAARKAAFERLKKARELLDAWLDKHADDQDRLDKLYCDVATRLFWIKKMSSVDELGESGGGAKPSDSPTPPPAKDVAKEPAKPAPPTPAEALAEIETYGAKHKGDVPGLHDRYQDFLAKHPDPSTPEFAKAMAQFADLDKRLKDVYRQIHDDDPDSLKNADGPQQEKMLAQLLDDLEKGSQEVRERAARFLGGLGSGKAADPLVKTLKREKSGPVFDAAADALAKIGGQRVCDRLLKVGKDADLVDPVVDILSKMLARGGPSGRIAGVALGGYVASVEPLKRPPVFDALAAAGPVGALGLARGLEHAPAEDVVKLIDALPAADDPRVVTYLAKFLVVNAPGDRAEFSRASREAIKKVGKRSVRYLIPALDDPNVAVWTARLLQEFTGQKLKDDKRKTWEAWFKMNRKAVEGK